MRNKLAEEVLDSDMLNLMIQYQKSLGTNGNKLDNSIELLKNTSQLIQNFRDCRPLTEISDDRLKVNDDVLHFFKEWETSVIKDNKLSKKEKCLLSHQTWQDISSLIIRSVQITNLLKTENYQYLERSSCHASSTFRGIIKGEMLRFKRCTNDPVDLQTKYALFSERLIKRGYPKNEIKTVIQEVTAKQRNDTLMVKPKSVLQVASLDILYSVFKTEITHKEQYLKTLGQIKG
ncbi:unnamed protein product [Mytilus coruscus]|uniref:Helix-turn-helix domain-containing protein n=1 Tax=Mytilus coruscus TaxID=42192 RepID=A0A6J8EMP4_MYTCO|nr:unnamed protein product [Mytilus coruscus]